MPARYRLLTRGPKSSIRYCSESKRNTMIGVQLAVRSRSIKLERSLIVLIIPCDVVVLPSPSSQYVVVVADWSLYRIR